MFSKSGKKIGYVDAQHIRCVADYGR